MLSVKISPRYGPNPQVYNSLLFSWLKAIHAGVTLAGTSVQETDPFYSIIRLQTPDRDISGIFLRK